MQENGTADKVPEVGSPLWNQGLEDGGKGREFQKEFLGDPTYTDGYETGDAEREDGVSWTKDDAP